MTARTPVSRLAALLRGGVIFYRFAFSPWFGMSCRFTPSCSAYAMQALAQHGALRGGAFAIRRICRCHPWGGAGHDPVPDCTGVPAPTPPQR